MIMMGKSIRQIWVNDGTLFIRFLVQRAELEQQRREEEEEEARLRQEELERSRIKSEDIQSSASDEGVLVKGNSGDELEIYGYAKERRDSEE